MREQKCPNCGGNEIVLENGQYRCTYCDTVFSYKTADKAVYKYAARISQAGEHLKMKNYDRAYMIAKELSDIHPTDPNPYTIMLFSITSNLTNYYLSKKDRMKAAKIWDKLEQLNAISQPMRNYAEKIHQKKINALESSFTEDKFSVGFGIFILILVLIYYPNYFQLSIILGIICLCYYCWKNRTLERIDLYQMEKSAKKTYNPFRISFDEFKKQNI